MHQHLIPFFVADRPASLRILRKVNLKNMEVPLGIMTHANTSKNFQRLVHDFPCDPVACIDQCDDACNKLSKRVIKMCDSGVFTKNGCSLEYEHLFNIYEEMGVDFGIMIDYLRDKNKTLKSARQGINEYRIKKRSFKFIGVAQGKTINEYLDCYHKLKEMGFEYVAIGGLLKKRINTSRYVYVRSSQVLYNVLEKIREEYPKDWLFALGCYSPSRHLRFEFLKLYGSDYKGWIFNYEPKVNLSEGYARSSRYRQVRTFISKEIHGKPFYLGNLQDDISNARSKHKDLVIVGCGAKKIWSTHPDVKKVPAKDAYVGSFFLANRHYAETFGDSWAILSAKYGMISPDYVIRKDYDKTFNLRNDGLDTRIIREQILEGGFHRFARIVVLGGSKYSTVIKESYAGMGIPILCPLEEYQGIGLKISATRKAVLKKEPLI